MATHKNQFEKGAILGINPLVQQSDSCSELRNVRLLSKENTSMVMQAMTSTQLLEYLPEGTIVRASKDFNGIVYFILEYEATGEGEIGSFPSPNYSASPISINGQLWDSDDLIPKYTALQNLKKIGQNFYSGFTTSYLSLADNQVVKMELQPEYDGTINIIFTDNESPIRLINTRFSVLSDNKFTIIDRQGNADTNLYSEDTLATTGQLILQSFSIVKVELDSVETGGTVKAGNYRYYFAYETADGNATAIIAESLVVSVFFGDTIGSMRGAKENANTDKTVKLILTGLDTAYSKLRVYFDYSAGDAANQTTLFQIESTFSITSDTISFTHTGSETITQTEVTSIQSNFASIDTVKDITQIGGYLVAANIKEKIKDYDELNAFAKRSILSSGFEYMPVLETISNTDSLSHLYTTKIGKNKVLNDFYNAGYANPMNIYYKMGYMEGEAYVFGIVYILSDGSLSPVFPLVGYDNNLNQYGQHNGGYISKNLSGEFDYKSIPDKGPTEIDSLIDGFNVNGGLNTKGIYRFPKRNNNYPNKFLDNGSVSISYLLAHIPQVKPANTVGAFFVRAPRNADRIAQGYATPTVKMRQSEVQFYTHKDITTAQLSDESYYKVMPMIAGWAETIKTDVDPYLRGLRVKRIIQNGRIDDPKRLACFIPDMFGNPAALSEVLNNRSLSVEFAGKVTAFKGAAMDLQNPMTNWYLTQKVSSVLQSVSIDNITGKTYSGSGTNASIKVNAQAYYTVKSNKLYNSGLFTSMSEAYLLYWVQGTLGSSVNDEYYMHFSAQFNDYIGLVLANTTNLISQNQHELWPALSNNTKYTAIDGKDFYGDSIPIAYLVNLYGSGGQRSTTLLRDIYQNIQGLSFSPISQRMSWEEIESQLDSERNIKLYGGDSFTTISFRRIYNTNMNPEAKTVLDAEREYFLEDFSNAKAGQVITLCTQNTNNPYLRTPDSTIVNTRKQVFLPYIDGSQNDIRKWRQASMMEPEPDGYNRGYSNRSNSVPQVPYDQDAPFLANHWFNRIIYFGPHVVNNFENNYRKWTGVSYKDYDTAFGEITSIATVNNMLACVWQSAVGFIPFQERTYAGASETGQVYVESSSVLGPKADIKSRIYGSRHMNSILATDNALYGFDAKNRKLWILTPAGVNCFSDYSLHPYLEKFATSYATQKITPGKENVVSGFNSFFSELWFSFVSEQNPDQNFTVVYSEKYAAEGDIRFTGFMDMVAYHYIGYSENMLSFNSKKDKHVLWKHDIYEQGFLKLYGESVKMKIGFIVNPLSDISKVYNNLAISSNHIYPEKIYYTVDGATAIQNIVKHALNNFMSANAQYSNGRVHIPIPNADTQTDDPIKAFLRKQLGNFDSEIEIQAHLQGRAMEIVLEYGGNKSIEILSAETDIDIAI